MRFLSSRSFWFLDVVLSALVVLSFFLPWMQMEIVPVKGINLNELAIENYGREHFMAKMIYGLYLMPILALYILNARIFSIKWFIIPAKAIMLALSLVAFYLILQFHLDEAYNIWMREGVIVCLAASLVLMGVQIGIRRSARYPP